MTRIRVSMDVPPFLVKTLDSPEEREAAFRLRHDIFHREHHGRELPDQRDADAVDESCDHLGVFHEERLVGTYRLNRAGMGDVYYAAERFHLDALWALDGAKIELGRACVAAEYRTGTTLHLLWRGIAEYVRVAGARYLFGCSSIRTVDPQEVAAIYRGLVSGGHVSSAVRVEVRGERRFPLGTSQSAAAPAALPPLFAMYLKIGARVVAEPAWDAKMCCADFLTLLDVDEMNGRFTRRYGFRERPRAVQPLDTPTAFPPGFREVGLFSARPPRS